MKLVSKLNSNLTNAKVTGAREKLLHSLLPSGRKKFVCLVDNSELEATEREQVEILHEVHQATRSGDEDVAAHLQLLALVTSRGTTVDYTWAQHSTVAQTTSLIKDLAGQLASWAHNEHKRLSADAVCERVVTRRVGPRSGELASLAHKLGQDRNQEGSSLSRAWTQSQCN